MIPMQQESEHISEDESLANKKLRCKKCREYQYRETMRLMNYGNFCDTTCEAAWIIEKSRKDQVKAKKKKNSEFKQKVRSKDVSYQHDITQPVFNRMRVLEEKLWYQERGLEPECISCKKKGDFCCGHFKTRGSQKNLAYDRMNSRLQCNTYCNKHLSGNINGNKNSRGYIKGLHERFGSEKAQEIIDYCESHTEVKKWTCEELIEIRTNAYAEIRRLEEVLGL